MRISSLSRTQSAGQAGSTSSTTLLQTLEGGRRRPLRRQRNAPTRPRHRPTRQPGTKRPLPRRRRRPPPAAPEAALQAAYRPFTRAIRPRCPAQGRCHGISSRSACRPATTRRIPRSYAPPPPQEREISSVCPSRRARPHAASRPGTRRSHDPPPRARARATAHTRAAASPPRGSSGRRR